MVLNTALETFEGRAKRILWLPSITLGYIYTITGSTHQFALAVGAIGGTTIFRALLESDFVTNSGKKQAVRSDAFKWISEEFSSWRIFVFTAFAVIYFASMLYAPYQLYQHFTHQNLILVGLAGTWLGVLIVLIVNY